MRELFFGWTAKSLRHGTVSGGRRVVAVKKQNKKYERKKKSLDDLRAGEVISLSDARATTTHRRRKPRRSLRVVNPLFVRSVDIYLNKSIWIIVFFFFSSYPDEYVVIHLKIKINYICLAII